MSDYFDYSTGRLTPGTTARSGDLNDTFDELDTGLDKLPTEAQLKNDTTAYDATDAGSANAVVVALPHTAASYVDGMKIVVKVGYTNTGAATINVDSLGVKSIRRQDGTALVAGDLVANKLYEMRYNSTSGYFEIQGSPVGSAGTGTMSTQNASAVAITGGTIYGVTISGSNFNQDGNITITDTGNTSDEIPLDIETPYLTEAGAMFIRYGVSDTEYNSVVQRFVYNAADSATNYLGIGISGHNDTLRIDGSENIGIGKTSGGAKLDVNGEIEATSLDINGNGDVSGTLTGGTFNPTTLQQGGVQAVTTTGAQTLTNKTLTSPTINTPTLTGGTVNPTTLQKGGVNVPSISESATLTNKTLTSPTINTPTINGGGPLGSTSDEIDSLCDGLPSNEIADESGGKTLTSGGVSIVTSSSLSVTNGDYILLEGVLKFTKGATGGESSVRVDLYSTTGQLTFCVTSLDGGASMTVWRKQVAASEVNTVHFTLPLKAIVTGDVAVGITGISAGSDSTLSSGDGSIGVVWIKKQ